MSTKKKNQFLSSDSDYDDDDSDSVDDIKLTIAKEYAEKMEKHRSKIDESQEFAKLQRFVNKQVAESDDSDESSEDSDAIYLDPKLDLQIHQVLDKIKKRDSSIYNANTTFYDEHGNARKKQRNNSSNNRISVIDMAKQQLISNDDDDDDDDNDAQFQQPTYNEEQRQIRRDLLDQANDDEDDDDFLTKKSAANDDNVDDDNDTKKQIMPYIENVLDTENEHDKAFLRDYLANQWWKIKDTSKLPSYRDIVGEEEPEQPDISEDEETLEKQDVFEEKHNFRYLEGHGNIVTYPRQLDDSVRKKDETRKEQRDERKQRKKLEKQKKIEEIKRLKNVKKREIFDRLKEIEQVSGTEVGKYGDALGLGKSFDADEHDKIMNTLFNDEFYDKVDNDDDEFFIMNSNDNNGDDNGKKTTKQKKQRDIISSKALKPHQYIAETRKKLKNAKNPNALAEFEKQLDELYALDVEDVIAGDTPCRYKYVEVPKCDYGLSAEDILFSTDKELNQVISMKKLAPYRDDADDNTPFWKRTSYSGTQIPRGSQQEPPQAAPPSKKKRRRKRRRKNKDTN